MRVLPRALRLAYRRGASARRHGCGRVPLRPPTAPKYAVTFPSPTPPRPAARLAAAVAALALLVYLGALVNGFGRTGLMAAMFAILAVWLALERDSLVGSALAWALGLLAKETAAVVPVLIAVAWLLGIGRPPGRRVVTYVAVWGLIGAAFAL